MTAKLPLQLGQSAFKKSLLGNSFKPQPSIRSLHFPENPHPFILAAILKSAGTSFSTAAAEKESDWILLSYKWRLLFMEFCIPVMAHSVEVIFNFGLKSNQNQQ